MMLGVGWYDAYDAFFASINGSQMNNMTGAEEMITYTQAIQFVQAGEAAGVTFAGNASIGDLSYAFDSAVMPTGEDASLTSMQGVLILAGHCNAFATATYGEVMADAANGFANVGTMQRASIWGYASADINATIATDFAVCFGVGGTFSMTHGGADDDWFQDPLAVDASTRMMNYLGLDIDNTVAMNLLFGGQGTDMPTGILATNLEEHILRYCCIRWNGCCYCNDNLQPRRNAICCSRSMGWRMAHKRNCSSNDSPWRNWYNDC